MKKNWIFPYKLHKIIIHLVYGEVNSQSGGIYFMKAIASSLIMFSLFIIACSDDGGGNLVVTVANVGGNPDGVTVSDAGNIYITDIASGEVKKVNEDGTSETIIDLDGSSNNLHPDGITAVTDASGNDILYVALIGAEDNADGKIVKIDTSTHAKEDYFTGSLIDPSGIAADTAGNLYVADESGAIYKINTNKTLETITLAGADLENPHGLTLKSNADGSITLYTTDQGSSSNNIVEITLASPSSATVISAMELTPETTGGLQDGSLNAAKFNAPHGITTDKNGAIFVADENNNRVAIITPNGNVVNFAGTGTAGDADGSGDSAQFRNPRGMATLPNGDVLICDYGNGKVRKVVR